MLFKDFISRQRVAIFVAGFTVFVVCLILASMAGFDSISGALFIDLAASAFTIVTTALIIDYLGLKEEVDRTHNAAGLAEDEIKATCFRIKWRLARLFGLERHDSERDNISSRQEARQYLDKVTTEVDDYLSEHVFSNDKLSPSTKTFTQYLERLQLAQAELEQALILYEYALSYSLRERILALRSELQIAERVLGFIDTSESFNEANLSLIRVTAQSVYDCVEAVLGHDSRVASGAAIHEKESPLS